MLSQKIHNSRFLTIYWLDKEKIMHLAFHKDTMYLDEKQYKKEMQIYAMALKKHKPISILANTIHFAYPIIPRLQDWVNDTVITLFPSIGVKKHAVIVSKDIFSQVSIEQTMAEARDMKFSNRYFEDERIALEWLTMLY